MHFNEDSLATCAPIRKPQRQKYTIKSFRRAAQKSMDRLLLLGGKLHWVEVDYSFDGLYGLLKQMACRDWEYFQRNLRDSDQLHSKRQVTHATLNELNYVLLRWSTAIEQDSGDIRGQREELRIVQDRQAFLFQHLKEKSNSEQRPQIVLDPNQTATFERLFQRVEHVAPIWNPPMRNLARFVFWCGGAKAFQRFSSAMNVAPRGYKKYLRLLQRAIDWTESLQKRLQTESRYSVGHDFDNNSLNDELDQWMQERNLSTATKGKIANRVEKAHKNFSNAQRQLASKTRVMVPSATAALAICTKQGSELVQHPIDYALEKESPKQNLLEKTAKSQIALSCRTCFPDLVRFVNQGQQELCEHQLWRVSRFIENGNHPDDIRFIFEADLSVKADCRLKPIRMAAERFDRVFGSRIDPKLFSQYFSCISSTFQATSMDRVVSWLELFPAEVFTRGLCERIMGVLQTLFQLSGSDVFRPRIAEKVSAWSNRSQQLRDCFDDEKELPRELRSWLRRLTYFQRLSGAEVRIPSSLKKLLQGPKREQKELQHLAKLEETQGLNHKQYCRLKSLLEKPFDQKRFEKQAILLTMELCVLSAIESLRTLLTEVVREVWTDVAGTAMPSDWSEQRCLEYSKWAAGMEPCQKRLLRDVMAAYVRHGSKSKSHLPFNREWIEQQRQSGRKIDDWLEPNTSLVQINSKKYRIEVAHDPFQILLMGSLFNTCLAPEGCNEMAVLANAAHANKHVIYVWNDRNQIVARKLIAVSRENGLLGYHLYIQSNDFEPKEHREELKKQVLIWCHQLASRVGWEITNLGTPLGLGHFWYDDGNVEW